MFDADWRAFIESRRSATLATVSGAGQPRLVPICFVLGDEVPQGAHVVLYTPLDEKPKRAADVHDLARVRDIAERPTVSVLFERWDEDWSQLAWLRARGRASIIEPDKQPRTHQRLVAAMRAKYPQYGTHRIDTAPMIRVVVDEISTWSATAAVPGG